MLNYMSLFLYHSTIGSLKIISTRKNSIIRLNRDTLIN